jgi:hypothetical protein
MNCEDIVAIIQDSIEKNPSDLNSHKAMEHIAGCVDCRDALQGREALYELRARNPATAPAGLFSRVIQDVMADARPRQTGYGFWHGTGFGAAVAASVIMAIMAFGVMRSPEVSSTPAMQDFTIALNEPRNINIAIEAGHDFAEATVSVFLSGDVELAGFGSKREISWTTSLAQGVNQLSLPIVATSPNGGTLLVRLDNEGAQKVFVVNLKTSG